MRKILIGMVVLLMFASVCQAYDLETLLDSKNRNVEITLKNGTQFSGIVWDVVSFIENFQGQQIISLYKIKQDNIAPANITGKEDSNFTRIKYYLIVRKGVIEYKIDSDDIALLGIQKW
ncbi:MAG: hypothetical protein HZB36_02515 [Candidatus Omnitrophica bacterium]|nr:hypothetical protein [Candidatus Omnitrophota bacterium]